jgi:putative transcriptional regulator
MFQPDTGKLLIADPFINEGQFTRSVVLVCLHSEIGSFGLILNKKTNYKLQDLSPKVSHLSLPVYSGGPVNPNTLHVVHQYPSLIKNSTEIANGIYWGGDFEKIAKSLKQNEIDPNKIKLFMGYCGWGSEQLTQEVNKKNWIISNSKREIIFNNNTDEIWSNSLRNMGGGYESLINYPINPQSN